MKLTTKQLKQIIREEMIKESTQKPYNVLLSPDNSTNPTRGQGFRQRRANERKKLDDMLAPYIKLDQRLKKRMPKNWRPLMSRIQRNVDFHESPFLMNPHRLESIVKRFRDTVIAYIRGNKVFYNDTLFEKLNNLKKMQSHPLFKKHLNKLDILTSLIFSIQGTIQDREYLKSFLYDMIPYIGSIENQIKKDQEIYGIKGFSIEDEYSLFNLDLDSF